MTAVAAAGYRPNEVGGGTTEDRTVRRDRRERECFMLVKITCW